MYVLDVEHRAECICPVCLDNLQFDDVQTFLIVKVGTIPIVGGTVLQCLQERALLGFVQLARLTRVHGYQLAKVLAAGTVIPRNGRWH